MDSITTRLLPAYINQGNHEYIMKLDRGDAPPSPIIKFQQEHQNIKEIPISTEKFISINHIYSPRENNPPSSKLSAIQFTQENMDIKKPSVSAENFMSIKDSYLQKENDAIADKLTTKLGKLITQQRENSIIDKAVNKQLHELFEVNKLKFYPMHPSVSTMNFDFDAKNNLVMHHTLQYDKYAECNPDGTIKKIHEIYQGDEPFVRVDLIVKFKPDGEILTKDNVLNIKFHGCSDELSSIFDLRSLWDKICDFFSNLLSSSSNTIDMKYIAPNLKEDIVDGVGSQGINKNEYTAPNSKEDTVDIASSKRMNKNEYTTGDPEYQTLLQKKYTNTMNKIKETDMAASNKDIANLTEKIERLEKELSSNFKEMREMTKGGLRDN